MYKQRLKRIEKLGLLALVGKGSEGVLGAQCLKNALNAQKLPYYLMTGPKLGGEGVRGASAKSQSRVRG